MGGGRRRGGRGKGAGVGGGGMGVNWVKREGGGGIERLTRTGEEEGTEAARGIQ